MKNTLRRKRKKHHWLILVLDTNELETNTYGGVAYQPKKIYEFDRLWSMFAIWGLLV